LSTADTILEKSGYPIYISLFFFLLPSKEIKTIVPEKDKPNKTKYIQLHANAILSAIEGGFARRKLQRP
jgi:hypothetical protein